MISLHVFCKKSGCSSIFSFFLLLILPLHKMSLLDLPVKRQTSLWWSMADFPINFVHLNPSPFLNSNLNLTFRSTYIQSINNQWIGASLCPTCFSFSIIRFPQMFVTIQKKKICHYIHYTHL